MTYCQTAIGFTVRFGQYYLPPTGDSGFIVVDNPLRAKLEGALPKHTPAKNDSRKEREIEILEEARNLLAEKGYVKFSMRGVAAAAGISLRTVQHYFPTKKDLLVETVKYTLTHYYHEQFHFLFEEHQAKEPVDKFLIVMDYMLEDLRDPFTLRFFTELWALSVRDKDAATAMDVIYTLHRKNFEELIRAINPGLSQRRVAHRASMAVVVIEGLTLLVGDGKPQHKELEGIEREVKSRILDVIMMPDDAPMY